MACENGLSCVNSGGSVVGLLDVDSFLLQVQAKVQADGDPTWRNVYENFPSALADGPQGNFMCPIVSANDLASYSTSGMDKKLSAWETKCVHPNLQVLWREQRYGKPETLSSHCAMNEIVNVLLNYKQQKGYSFLVERGEGSQVYVDLSKDTKIKSKQVLPLTMEYFFDSMYLETSTESLRYLVIHSHYLKTFDDSTKPCQCLSRLIYGAIMMNELSCELLRQTSFSASCGVATNKLLAWFARNSHKPNGVTILTKKGFTERLGLNFRIDEIPFLSSSAVAELKLHFKKPLIITIKQFLDKTDDKMTLKGFLGTKNSQEVRRVCDGIWNEPVKNQPYVPSMTKTLKVDQPVYFFGSYFEVKDLLTLLVKEVLEFLVEERKACLRVTERLQVTFSPPEVPLEPKGFKEDSPKKFPSVSVPLPHNLNYQHESSDEDAGRIVDSILVQMNFHKETLNTQISSITATVPNFVDLISQPFTF